MEKMTVTISENKEDMAKAARLLSLGGIIILPTEEGYSVGCDATRENAIEELNQLTNNEDFISVLVDKVETIKQYGKITEVEEALASKYMPGHLTIVVQFKKAKKFFGFRISSNRTAHLLAKEFKKPIYTIALKGKDGENIHSANELDNFQGKVNLIIDAGSIQQMEKTTILGINPDIRVYREGVVPKLSLANFLKNRL